MTLVSGSDELAGKNDDDQDHRVHTACDLERYSGLRHDDQGDAQRDLEGIQQRAAKHAHLRRDRATVQRAGDGDLTRWPAGVTAAQLLAHYVPALHNELVRINKRLSPDKQMRMRFAIVAGTSESGAYGLVGDAPVTVSRLADAPELRQALAGAPGHPLVVIVDDPIYQDVIRPEISHLDPRHYNRVEIRNEAKGFERIAWITVPGRPGDAPVHPTHPAAQQRDSAIAKAKTALLNRWTLIASGVATAATLMVVAIACGQEPGSDNQAVAVSGAGNSVNQNSGTCGQVNNNSTCVVQLEREVNQTARSSQTDADFKLELAKQATADPTGPGPWPFVVVDTFVAGQDWGLFARTSNQAAAQRLGTAANRSMVWADCVARSDFTPADVTGENNVGPQWLHVRWKPGDPTGRSISEPNEPQHAWMYLGATVPLKHNGKIPACK